MQLIKLILSILNFGHKVHIQEKRLKQSEERLIIAKRNQEIKELKLQIEQSEKSK